MLLFAVAVGAGACSGGGSGSPTSPSGSSGTFNLRITDSPYGSAKAVLVTFSEVSMHRDGTWTKVPFADGSGTTWTCDLKKLQNSAQDLLGIGPLEAGQYTMVRLMVQSAKIYFDNSAVSATPCARTIAEPSGGSAALTIPSGEVKLNGVFTLAAGGATTVLVDFDGESSIRETGNGTFMMSPVVRILSVQ
jgi:hypothetical protein